MAHHQGMTIVAIADALMEGAMRARFHTEPMIRAAELLLQERMPREVAVQSPWASEASVEGSGSSIRAADVPSRRSSCPDASYAPALEWSLQRYADGRRLGIQPLAGLALHDGERMPSATTGDPTSIFETSRAIEVWSAGFTRPALSRITTRSLSARIAPLSRGETAS